MVTHTKCGKKCGSELMGRLSATAVKAARTPGRYGDGDGLCLLVGPGGSKSWVVRVQKDGRRRDVGLGSEKKVSLAESAPRSMRGSIQFSSAASARAFLRSERWRPRSLPSSKRAGETPSIARSGYRPSSPTPFPTLAKSLLARSKVPRSATHWLRSGLKSRRQPGASASESPR
jgi:hypothetical protein